MRHFARFAILFAAPILALCGTAPGQAQTQPNFAPSVGDGSTVVAATPEIIFAPGTGDPATTATAPPQPIGTSANSRITCSDVPAATERLSALYGKIGMPVASPELADAAGAVQDMGPPPPPHRLDRNLLQTALASYRRHNCRDNSGSGPANLTIVDFARPSSEPRLYIVNLTTGQGIDTPVPVAHGIGSDPNDDGVADRFSNVYNSLASSLGAARGAELYYGANGLSLRLDGLDPSNSQMRVRDIVVHSYQPERRRYFNASLLSARQGKPGTSEGCFVVAPHLRDWLFDALRDGGFLFAGLGGNRIDEMRAVINPPPPPRYEGEVVFVSGTGG